MERNRARSLDDIAKSFFTHAVAAADLLNSLAPDSAGELGLGTQYLPQHVTPMLGQELRSSLTYDKRMVDVLFSIRTPDRGHTLGVVHVEVQDRVSHDMWDRCWEYQKRILGHLRHTSMVEAPGLPLPVLQLLVHTGRGVWPQEHRPFVPVTARRWPRYQFIPMLDLGSPSG